MREANIQLKGLLEQQRENYTKMLSNTEKRVVQANMSITSMFNNEAKDEEKKKAAEYLSA